MEIKNFHYISNTKVEMLLSQTNQSVFSFSNLTPKVEVGGFGFGVEYSKNNEIRQNIISKTLSLHKSLTKKKLIQNISQFKMRNGTTFISDNGKWFHGLFSLRYPDFYEESPINKEKDEIIVIYALCKIQGKSIFLNFGSPNNLVGEKDVKHGIALSGLFTTGRTYHHLLNIFENVNETPWEMNPRFLDLRTRAPEKPPIDVNLAMSEKWSHTQEIETHSNKPKPEVYLTQLCLEHLTLLPERNIETLFMIYDKFDNPTDNWETLYLGSPIYTALT